MATSSTLFFPPRIQSPVRFVHYSGPKTIHKSVPARATGDDEATGVEASLVNSVATNAPRETTEPSGSVSRGPTTAMADDTCFETHGAADQVECGRGATVDAFAEGRVSSNASEETAAQDDRQRSGNPSSTQRIPELQQKAPSPRPMESDGAEFDYLFDAPIETHDPALSPRSGGSSRSRSLSQSDLDADTSDVSSLHHSSQRFRKRRKRSYAERSVEPSSLLSVSPDSATSEGTVQEQGRCMRGEKDHPLDRSEPVSFAIDRRPRERRKGRSSVGSLARGVFIHRTQSRDTVSEVSRQKTNNLQTPGREPQVQQAFQECRKIRSSGRILRPEESASRTMAPEECADGRFGRATYGSLVPKGSSASKTSLSRLAAMQTPSADASQRATWKAARDLCIQSISPDLSFLFCILPDLASVQALIHPGDGHRPVACLENPDGLDNVIVKQLGPTNWLLAGTVRTEPKVSPVGTCPEDDLSNQELENASADENTTNLSDDEAEEQFSAKNQRWSEEDDRTLCQWVKAGRPWCWIVRQFPMRTPGSVRTRYSTLQRKSRQS